MYFLKLVDTVQYIMRWSGQPVGNSGQLAGSRGSATHIDIHIEHVGVGLIQKDDRHVSLSCSVSCTVLKRRLVVVQQGWATIFFQWAILT